MKPAASGLDWRTSSYSSSQGGNCVEVASKHCHTHLRDSKNPEHGHFSFASSEWSHFLATVVTDTV